MLYKPNYCCNCGEKIERVEWNLLTSRRFCPACAVEHRRFDFLPRASVAVGALALMFGIGSLWSGSAAKPTDVPQPVGIRSALPSTEGGKPAAAAPVVVQQPSQASAVLPSEVDAPETKPQSTTAYFCGALTKKGTPCSRKVKAKATRCFQHEGRPEAPPS